MPALRSPITLSAIALASILAALSACRTPTVAAVSDHSVLPASWQSRQPFRSPEVTLFAKDEGAADEVGRFAAQVAADFRRLTGREPSSRLLLIVGSRDWLSGADPCTRLRLAAIGEAAIAGKPAPSEAEFSSDCRRSVKDAAAAGLELPVLLVMRPDTLTAECLVAELAFPPAAGAAIDWAIVVPTRSELSAAVRQVLDAAMEKERPSFGERLLIAPLLPWIRGKAADAARAGFQQALFAAHAAAQPDWSPAERKRQLELYAAELEVELGGDSPLPSSPRDEPHPPAATAPVIK